MSDSLLPRWVPPLLGVVAVALIPWTLWLTFALPSRHVTHHYRDAWVGFDVALAASFAMTAVAALRLSRWLPIAAAVNTTLLVCDAWFDVVTSGHGGELVEALVEAAAAEVPLAALCAWIVWDVHGPGTSHVHRFARRVRVGRDEAGRTPA